MNRATAHVIYKRWNEIRLGNSVWPLRLQPKCHFTAAAENISRPDYMTYATINANDLNDSQTRCHSPHTPMERGFTLPSAYKLLSLTYKVLTTTQPLYLHNLISV